MRILIILCVASAALCGEVTDITHSLTGHDSFTSIRVFIDGCDQTDPNSVCDLEGNLYPCCHIDAGATIQGSLTMINEEDLVSNGDISCDGVGWGKQQPCIDPEFCNGVNSTCPIAGGASVEFKFGLSTDGWTHISIGSRLEKIELRSQDGKEMLSFGLHFKVN